MAKSYASWQEVFRSEKKSVQGRRTALQEKKR